MKRRQDREFQTSSRMLQDAREKEHTLIDFAEDDNAGEARFGVIRD